MSALFPQRLTAPRIHVGTVDATRDRLKPVPRTLEQAFGPTAVGGVIVPMDTQDPMPHADRVVTVVSACIGVVLLGFLALERLFS